MQRRGDIRPTFARVLCCVFPPLNHWNPWGWGRYWNTGVYSLGSKICIQGFFVVSCFRQCLVMSAKDRKVNWFAAIYVFMQVTWMGYPGNVIEKSLEAKNEKTPWEAKSIRNCIEGLLHRFKKPFSQVNTLLWALKDPFYVDIRVSDPLG